MHVCGKCKTALPPDKNFVICKGVCDRKFHLVCADIDNTLYGYITSCEGLSWKCPDCNKNCFSIDHVGLNSFLNDKHSEILSNLNTVFSQLKSDFLKLAETKFFSTTSTDSNKNNANSYSEKLKNNTKPVVIVKPKDPAQLASLTKVDIVKNINPAESQLSIAKVRTIKDGGVVIGCSTSEDNARFKEIAQKKLSDKYVIKEFKGILPSIKVVGMTENYSAEDLTELLEHVIKRNDNVFNLNSVCRVLKIWPTKKNKDVFQAIFQVDRETYSKILQTGGIFIGFDYCSVFDAVHVTRCFKCCGYNHLASKCPIKETICPKCGSKHEAKDCKSETYKCVNCVSYNAKNKFNVDTEHTVWDPSCTAYSLTVDKLRKDLMSQE